MKATRIDQFTARGDSDHSPYVGSAKEFQGDVILQRLVTTEDSREIELLAVFFSAGARTRPHVHDVDQVLHILRGQGIVADETERRNVSSGDVITVPSGVWHWHGATPDSPMCHISIRQPGSKTDWEVEEKDWATSYGRQAAV